ncbi:hypothetical protein B5K08_26845 [Rhizobium leguminosarum bv. trifolii]|uniref:Uncharacterized protein n=1 Tax=Rhizobium leguminosarum bv. trifolii TaxID=386 RepID=A0A3E1B5M1_RHILT|nr:hypothetical protein B5K08_26845 [Rhizobium leguminosarum bv. trifolii]RFB86198.1 hypothetical protein B5K10_25560 [Rhizobium leguminosarum bv. trifolii]
MRANETELQMIMRHIQDGDAIVARQTGLLKRLVALRLPTKKAGERLTLGRIQFEHILHLQRLSDWTTLEGKSDVQ